MGGVAHIAAQGGHQLLGTPAGQHTVRAQMLCLMLIMALELPTQADPDQDPSEKGWQIWRWLSLHKKRG